MEQHIYKRKSDGIYIINLKSIWESFLAVRATVATETPADASVISSRNAGQQAEFATGAALTAGCFTPGIFTNHTQVVLRERRLLVVTGLALTTSFSQRRLTL